MALPPFNPSWLSAHGGLIGLSCCFRRRAWMGFALRSGAARFCRCNRRRAVAIRVEGLDLLMLSAQGGSSPFWCRSYPGKNENYSFLRFPQRSSLGRPLGEAPLVLRDLGAIEV